MRSVGLALLALCAVSAAPGPKLVFRTDDRQHTCNLLMTGASKLELQDDSGNSGCDLHVGGVSLATELRELQTRQRQFETSQSAMQRTLTDLGVGVSDLKSAHQRLQADVSSVQAQLGSNFDALRQTVLNNAQALQEVGWTLGDHNVTQALSELQVGHRDDVAALAVLEKAVSDNKDELKDMEMRRSGMEAQLNMVSGDVEKVNDCHVSAWSAWSACSKSCGAGVQTLTRSVLRRPVQGGELCPHLVETKPCNLARCCKLSLDAVTSTGVHTMCGAGQEHDVYVQVDGGVKFARVAAWGSQRPISTAQSGTMSELTKSGTSPSVSGFAKFSDSFINAIVGQSNRVLRATAPGYSNVYIRTNKQYSDSTHSMGVGPQDGWTRSYVGGSYNRGTINGGGRFSHDWIDFLYVNAHGQGEGCNRWFMGHGHFDCYAESQVQRCFNTGANCGRYRKIQHVSVWVGPYH